MDVEWMSRNIASKIFEKITTNHSLSQSQKQTKATDIKEEIRMSINLPCAVGTSERLRIILQKRKTTSFMEEIVVTA